MRKIYTLISLVVFVISIGSCKTASKLYDNGNYDEAVDLAVKKLQKKPNNEMKALLQNAYQYAVNDHETRIHQLTENSSELKWEWMYGEYLSLQRLYEAIHRSPEAMAVVNAVDYSTYLHTYADKAADTRFQRGMMWMSARTTQPDRDKNDKTAFRNAYIEFNAPLGFRPGDLSLADKRNEAYQRAVINVVVLPMNNYAFKYGSYGNNEFRNLENDLLLQLQVNTGNNFVKFYSSWDASSRNIQPDQFIELQFGSLNFGRANDENRTTEVSKEVVVKETVYRSDSVVKQYKRVFARITTTTRRMYSEGNLQINIRDANGNWLWNDEVRGVHNWVTEFATYTGDERALSKADFELINCKQVYPPRENEITRLIMNEIKNNMLSRVRNYYSCL